MKGFLSHERQCQVSYSVVIYRISPSLHYDRRNHMALVKYVNEYGLCFEFTRNNARSARVTYHNATQYVSVFVRYRNSSKPRMMTIAKLALP